MHLTKLLALITPHDGAKDSGLFLLFTSPWAFLSSLNWTVIFGLLNLLILAIFRWRSLKLKAREIELHHTEELVTLRARLSVYEPEHARPAAQVQERDRQPLLPRAVRQRSAPRNG